MKQELLDKIIERSRTRKDGIYTLDCIKYSVRNGHLMFFIDFNEVFQFSQGFIVSLGKIDCYKGRSKLKELMRNP